MKTFFIFLMGLFYASTSAQGEKDVFIGADSAALRVLEIKLLIYQQQEAWNLGSVDSFMHFYWRSDSLKFISSKGITMGWHSLRARYQHAYPNPQEMGKLRFSELDMVFFDEGQVSLVTGKWELLEKEKPASGYFQIVLKRIDGVWKIITDITN